MRLFAMKPKAVAKVLLIIHSLAGLLVLLSVMSAIMQTSSVLNSELNATERQIALSAVLQLLWLQIGGVVAVSVYYHWSLRRYMRLSQYATPVALAVTVLFGLFRFSGNVSMVWQIVNGLVLLAFLLVLAKAKFLLEHFTERG